MALSQFQPQQFTDADPASLPRQLTALMGALRRFFRPLELNTMLDNVHLSDVVLTTLTNTTVNHKLGRTPQEWLVTRINGPSTIYEVSRSDTTLVLYSSGTVTVDLRVS